MAHANPVVRGGGEAGPGWAGLGWSSGLGGCERPGEVRGRGLGRARAGEMASPSAPGGSPGAAGHSLERGA